MNTIDNKQAPMSSTNVMFQLMFSEISEEEKQLIAYKNYDRLLEGRRKI